MRMTIISIPVFLIIACFSLVIGCGDSKTTIKTPEGEIEVTGDHGGMTIKTDEGETSFSTMRW